MHPALEKEKELHDKVISDFPHAVHSTFLVGRDQIPFGSLIFCDGARVGRVAAFRTGQGGWVISQLPDGAGGYVLHIQNGYVRQWTEENPKRRKRRAR